MRTIDRTVPLATAFLKVTPPPIRSSTSQFATPGWIAANLLAVSCGK